MRVTVLLFASCRDVFGTNQRIVDLDEPVRLSGLFHQVMAGRASPVPLSSLRFAVNEEMAEGDPVVKDGDTVAFLPPMSGG